LQLIGKFLLKLDSNSSLLLEYGRYSCINPHHFYFTLKIFASGAEGLSFYHSESIPWCRHLLQLVTLPGIATFYCWISLT